MRNQPKLTAISVPFDLGAACRGASQGPEAIMQAGLLQSLRILGFTDIQTAEVALHPGGFKPLSAQTDTANLHYLAEIAALNTKLAEQVSGAVQQGRFPLVLGGDHSIAIGSIAGLARHYRKLGVIWIDAHSDLNTAKTSPSGNIHGMSLAVSLGLGHPLLTDLLQIRPKIRPEHVVLIGSRSLDEGEKKLIRSLGIKCYTMYDIDRKGMAAVMQEAINYLKDRTDGVHLSYDVDSLDPMEAPGTGTAVKGGLLFREAFLAVEMLCESGIVTSAEFVEVNPLLDRENTTSELTAGLICSLMGDAIL
ncbi:arginase [Paenibacillus oryzisoli]|uniref:arginase n=1 Tax=Paenibacillus oryzisoli TaxID=1850517 RepID=UPI003D27E126